MYAAKPSELGCCEAMGRGAGEYHPHMKYS